MFRECEQIDTLRFCSPKAGTEPQSTLINCNRKNKKAVKKKEGQSWKEGGQTCIYIIRALLDKCIPLLPFHFYLKLTAEIVKLNK